VPLRPPLHLSPLDQQLSAGFAAVRAELGVPAGYPEPALREAREAAARDVSAGRLDARDLEFVTIDPPGSMDLDQALHIERRGSGYRVHYAIADLPAFVQPGGALDAETHARGETYYAPDGTQPLHPRELSEGAASLLPEVDRPAQLWQLDLDSSGELERTEVRRAMVRSRARLDYAGVQRQLDSGAASEALLLLSEVGKLRQERATARGAVTLNLPEQLVERGPDGSYELTYRAALAVEGWNAEISLLTGIAAARLMIEAKVGLLRTLPKPSQQSVASYRRSALALGVAWPEGMSYGAFVTSLNPEVPSHAALVRLATMLVRGAGYVAFDGTVPDDAEHSAVASPYSHVTAPLRRLVDRYTGATCVALCAGEPVPPWVRAALPLLPEEMASADHRAHALDRAVIDVAEAVMLAPRVGEEFDAVVVEADAGRGEVQLRNPAVRARCDGQALPLGREVKVRLVVADPATRALRFALV
jgi:exoribonuclease R